MVYQDPRAYLLGIEGIALLRAFAGGYDRDFAEARIAEIRRVLADAALAGAAVDVDRVDTVTGYRWWSATYDEPNSAMLARGRALGPVGPWERWPWGLADLVPEATRAANAEAPALVIWHFPRGAPADSTTRCP